MLVYKNFRLPLTILLLLFLFGCNTTTNENNIVQMKNNQGIYFSSSNTLYPVYSLKALDTSGLIGESQNDTDLERTLLMTFYKEKELKIPINELSINAEAKLFLNKNFKKPIHVNIIYSDLEREVIIPYNWEEDYVQFDINNFKTDVVYTFQISYIKKESNAINHIETYMFSIIFKL